MRTAREVIVSASIQAANDIFRGVTSGEQKDRYPNMLQSEALRNLQAVQGREHHVEDDLAKGSSFRIS